MTTPKPGACPSCFTISSGTNILKPGMVKDAAQFPPSAVPKTAANEITPVLDEPYEQKNSWPLIASKEDIPEWLRDNDYIINGHPMPTYSYRRSFRFWRCLHMETVNIWTHLLGSAVFIITIIGISLFQCASASRGLSWSTGDLFAFYISLFAAAVFFSLSATFHTLRSHLYKVHHFWGKMNNLGTCTCPRGWSVDAILRLLLQPHHPKSPLDHQRNLSRRRCGHTI